jgi:hypothetical protein
MRTTMSDDYIRSLLAREASPEALASSRRQSIAIAVLFGGFLLFSLVTGRSPWSSAIFFPLATLRAALLWRKTPQLATDITAVELAQARAHVRPCSRCGREVHPAELRCPQCGSIWHHMTLSGGRDAWIPLAILGTCVAVIVGALWIR